jgi:hypothetical protein
MQILSDIRLIIEETRNRVARSINSERTVAYHFSNSPLIEWRIEFKKERIGKV